MNESPTLKAQEILQKRLKNNIPTINAGLGANPLEPPSGIIEKVKQNAHKKYYGKTSGIDELNDALSQRYNYDFFFDRQFVVGCGVKELLYFTIMQFEGTIILVNPSWVSYKEQLILKEKMTKSKNYIEINTSINNNYKLTCEQFESIKLDIINKNHMIILNNPNNPTGAVYSDEELHNLSILFKKYNTIVLYDEIYKEITFDSQTSICDHYDNVIVTSGMSKDFACGGYRVGWLIFSDKLKKLYNDVKIIFSCVSSCAPIPLQYGTAYALQYNQEITNYLNESRKIFKYIGNKCYDLLQEANIKSSKPQGGWYIFIDLRDKPLILTDNIMKTILDETDVLIVSGSSFNYNKYSFRYSFVDIKDKLDLYFETGELSSFDSCNAIVGILSLVNWLR